MTDLQYYRKQAFKCNTAVLCSSTVFYNKTSRSSTAPTYFTNLRKAIHPAIFFVKRTRWIQVALIWNRWSKMGEPERFCLYSD